MSKTLTVGMQGHVAQSTTSLAWALQLSRKDGEVFRFVSGSRNITLGGNPYLAAPGFDVSSITCTAGIEVDTAELMMLTDDELTKADFLSGRWDGCRVEFNQYNWANAAHGFIPWPFYRVSDITPVRGGVKLELRDGRQLWRQDFTRSTGKTCPYRLGDAKCGLDLGPFTFAVTVTGVTSRSVFTCSGLAQAADYFTEGMFTFDDGLHADLPLLIRLHEAGGLIRLAVPLLADVVIGQTGVIVAGCLKRRGEDCRDKFDNVLNFGGVGVDAPTAEELVGQ